MGASSEQERLSPGRGSLVSEVALDGPERLEQVNIWSLKSFPDPVPAQTGWGLRLHLLDVLKLESLFVTAVVPVCHLGADLKCYR